MTLGKILVIGSIALRRHRRWRSHRKETAKSKGRTARLNGCLRATRATSRDGQNFWTWQFSAIIQLHLHWVQPVLPSVQSKAQPAVRSRTRSVRKTRSSARYSPKQLPKKFLFTNWSVLVYHFHIASTSAPPDIVRTEEKEVGGQVETGTIPAAPVGSTQDDPIQSTTSPVKQVETGILLATGEFTANTGPALPDEDQSNAGSDNERGELQKGQVSSSSDSEPEGKFVRIACIMWKFLVTTIYSIWIIQNIFFIGKPLRRPTGRFQWNHFPILEWFKLNLANRNWFVEKILLADFMIIQSLVSVRLKHSCESQVVIFLWDSFDLEIWIKQIMKLLSFHKSVAVKFFNIY